MTHPKDRSNQTARPYPDWETRCVLKCQPPDLAPLTRSLMPYSSSNAANIRNRTSVATSNAAFRTLRKLCQADGVRTAGLAHSLEHALSRFPPVGLRDAHYTSLGYASNREFTLQGLHYQIVRCYKQWNRSRRYR